MRRRIGDATRPVISHDLVEHLGSFRDAKGMRLLKWSMLESRDKNSLHLAIWFHLPHGSHSAPRPFSMFAARFSRCSVTHVAVHHSE